MLKLQRFCQTSLNSDETKDFLESIPYFFTHSVLKIYAPKYGENENCKTEKQQQLINFLCLDCDRIEGLAKRNNPTDCSRLVLPVIPVVLCVIDCYSKLSQNFLRIAIDYDFDPNNLERFGMELYLVSQEDGDQDFLPLKYSQKIDKAIEQLPQDLRLFIINNLHAVWK